MMWQLGMAWINGVYFDPAFPTGVMALELYAYKYVTEGITEKRSAPTKLCADK